MYMNIKENIMGMTLKKNDIIRFKTRGPQVHIMEMFGHQEFNPEEIEKEEYTGRIKAVIGDGGPFLMTTLSPLKGFICIADAEEVIRKVSLEELSFEELTEYNVRNEHYEAPNTYINDSSEFPSDASAEDKCRMAAEHAIEALFPDTDMDAIRVSNLGFYEHESFPAMLNFCIDLISDESWKKEMSEIRDRLVEYVRKARFKEYYEVNVSVKEDDTSSVGWIVAVDKNFEEVSIMRNGEERSDFIYSLGPEYYDIADAYWLFRRRCFGEEGQ